MDRRTFLERVCVTVAGTAVIGPLSNFPIDAKGTARANASDVREIPIDLVDNPDLKPVGGTYNLEFDDLDRNILVVHVKPDLFVGVDIKCTHANCEVNYDRDNMHFYCPCHGSTFDVYGRVTKGPATVPLGYYHAELQGDEVMVTLYGSDDPVPKNCIPPPAVDSTRH